MTSASSFSRSFLSAENRFLIFFSAFLILTLMSVLALASGSSYFCRAKLFLLPVDPDFYCYFLIFSCSLILKSLSSSMAGRTNSSGSYSFGCRFAKLTGEPSKFIFLGGRCLGTFSTFDGLGWITAPIGWLKRGSYLNDSKSLAFAT